ncbi:MAG: hypothetical protein H6736_18190 [Alphaproteobacteria bacterium]|nr:hypothetical protein [Alphaproteobacteria bacterium]MCB9693745.1 hypothetical protein [Alphaproteobacteria bacterium]
MRSDRLLALLLVACGYDAPLDPQAPLPGSVITGEVLVTGVEVPGDVAVLVYAADDPPPPAGTGRPLTFTTVPAAAFTGPGAGVAAAPYALTDLPAGAYLLQALMDLDGDFNPFEATTAGATCGDVGGAHLGDLATGEVAVVELGADLRLDDVTIVVGSVVPIERPAFFVASETAISRAGSLNPTTPQRFTLAATAVHTAFGPTFPLDLQGPCTPVEGTPLCDPTVLDLCDTAVWVHVKDADGNGLPDLRADLPAEAGIPDIWPRVYLQLLGAPEGESWSAEAIPLLAEIGAMQLGAPQPLPFGTPVPLAAASVTWLPVAKHVHPNGALVDPRTGEAYDVVDLRVTADPASIPAGTWAVTVVSESGQTWSVPNRLAEIGVSTRPDAFDPSLQGLALPVD